MFVPQTAAQTTIRERMPQPSAEVKVKWAPGCPEDDQLCGFEEGQRVVIFDDTGAYDPFTVTEVQTDALHLQHRDDDFSKAYEEDAVISQIESHTYYLRTDVAANTFQLMHYDGYMRDEPLVLVQPGQGHLRLDGRLGGSGDAVRLLPDEVGLRPCLVHVTDLGRDLGCWREPVFVPFDVQYGGEDLVFDLDRLAGALGFHYARDPASGQIAHPSVVFVLTPDGILSQSLQGIRYEPADVEQALARARAGTPSKPNGALDAVLNCFRFDPTRRKYGWLIVLGLQGLAAALVLGLCAAGWLLIRKGRRA